MTELMQMYIENREATVAKIKEMDNGLLLAELDDTIQFDIMKMSNLDWVTLPRDKAGVYRAIVRELYSRLSVEYPEAEDRDNG